MKIKQVGVGSLLFLLSTIGLAGGLEPEHVSFSSYNGEVRCETAEALYSPATIEAVIEIVRQAAQEQKKVRAIGTRHSSNSLICGDGIVISTENLKKIIGIESNQTTGVPERVVVEPGVQLGDLADYLHEKNLSVGYAHLGFRSVSVGGLIATGAHGSSVKHSASMSALVDSVTIIDSSGLKREISVENTQDTPNLMKAVRTHLGVFGVVVEIKFRIQPQFNLHMRTEFLKDSALFQSDGLLRQFDECDFGEMLWFPSARKFMKICGTETQEDPNLGANNHFLSPTVSSWMIQLYQSALEIGAKHRRLNQFLEKLRYLSYRRSPVFRKLNATGEIESVNEVIGPSHRMMSSELLQNAIGFPQANWEIAVPNQYTQEVLEFIQQHFQGERLAAPTMGVLLRFIPSESALLLAHNTSDQNFIVDEPVALFEFIIYSPKGLSPQKKAAYWERYQSIAKYIIEKYKGRPHWGKNEDWFFSAAKTNNNYGENLEIFRSEMQKIDPKGMFLNPLTQSFFEPQEKTDLTVSHWNK